MKALLGFRGRELSAGLATMGLAVVAPSGLKGADVFLRAPLGLGVLALAAIALGMSVEETGTVRRIRLGIAIRLLAPCLLAAGGIWAALTSNERSPEAFGFALFVLGAALTLYAARHDVAVLADLRSGQPIRLEEISGGSLRLSINHGETGETSEIIIPTSELVGAAAAQSLDGRGVFITVKSRDHIKGNAGVLPWVAVSADGDTFLLTEHQAAMDTEALIAQLRGAAQAGRQGGYR
jgi:hypothetical protein